MPPTASEIRQQFIDYFAIKHGHMFVPSGKVVPFDDPTLLFTNAGMNQFKDVFLATGKRNYNRAVNSQKCIRAGGKHNDLEDVGRDTYHHTFFEMLGNWSFGDYFKAEAIEWAWDLLTNVWGLEKDRIYATVFAGDETDGMEADTEAEELWTKVTDIDPANVSRWDKKDNFWEMGETGPCGPCSEIHYDCRSPEERAKISGSDLVNRDNPDVIEIWNLVFIQFNRGDDRSLTPLPAQHVDTGMGFERVARILQGKTSNYDTDLWLPIFKAIQWHTKADPYGGKLDDPIDIAYRVLADHIRCLTVAISDGAQPGNEGRSYVLRRILRRALRIAHQTMSVEGPVLFELVPSVIESLGEAFPGLKKNPDEVANVIRNEEEAFLKTIDRGLERFGEASKEADEAFKKAAADAAYEFYVTKSISEISDVADFVYNDLTRQGKIELGSLQFFSPNQADWTRYKGEDRPTITGKDAFMLHDTYGFPIDLTQVMAQERGMSVDLEGFEALMEQARDRSRKTGGHVGESGKVVIDLPPDAIASLQKMGIEPTIDEDKYLARPLSVKVQAIWNGDDFDNVVGIGRTIAVITNRTNFYTEQGGQVGDHGSLYITSEAGAVGMRTTRDHFIGLGSKLSGDEGSSMRGAVRFKIEETKNYGGYVLHIGHVIDGNLNVGDRGSLKIDRDRRTPILANHTATHLLNHALRTVLGEDINQKGSLVAPDRLRFDFSHSGPMTMPELSKVEQLVNDAIHHSLRVHSETVPLALAEKIHGVRAVFGEQYPDPVRVVSIGKPIKNLLTTSRNPEWSNYSIEFCGGTHLHTTLEAMAFVIIQEQALASGIRRVTALTGPAAMAAREAGAELESRLIRACEMEDKALVAECNDIGQLLGQLTISATERHKLTGLIEELKERVKAIRKQENAAGRQMIVEQARMLAETDQGPVIVHEVLGADKETLLVAMDVIRARHPQAAAMLFTSSEVESKVVIVAGVPEILISKGLRAGDWVREAAQICGGGGGGRPDLAQAGGKDPDKVDEAITKARAFAQQAIS